MDSQENKFAQLAQAVTDNYAKVEEKATQLQDITNELNAALADDNSGLGLINALPKAMDAAQAITGFYEARFSAQHSEIHLLSHQVRRGSEATNELTAALNTVFEMVNNLRDQVASLQAFRDGELH